MKRKIISVAIISVLAISLVACSSNTTATTTVESVTAETTVQETTAEITTEASETQTDSEMFTDRDFETDYTVDTTISLKDNGSTTSGNGAKVDGNTITISKKGTYLVQGTLKEGQIVVDVDGESVQLVLDGVTMTNSGNACIYVANAKKVFVTTAEGSENTLETTGEFTQVVEEKSIDGVIFSKDDICFNGLGTLNITSGSGHGIVAKDDFKATSGTLVVTAGSKAIDANDSVRIADGNYKLSSGTDTIHVENTEDTTKGFVYICGGTFDITSGSDGIDATGLITIDGGDFTIYAADDGIHSETELVENDGNINVESCYEGFEAIVITINGGTNRIVASDDGINANGRNSGSMLTINGGETELIASGDGADSNGAIYVNGGKLLISGPENNGDGSIDFEYSGSITGGTVVAAGSSGMAMNFGSDSTQPSFLCSFSSAHQSGDTITVTDSSGKEIISYTPSLRYNCVVVSTPDMVVGETYTVTAGSESQTIEMTSTIVGGSSFGFGGPGGGGPGGMQPGGGGQPGGGPGGGGQGGGRFNGGEGQPGMQTP